MRVILLLILISINLPSLASFVKKSELCNEGPTTNYQECPKGHSCYKLPKGHKCETFSLVPEMENGDAVYSENEIEVCDSEESCGPIYDSKTCSDPDEWVEIRGNNTEVFCTKFLNFEQVPTGKQVLELDPTKKAAHDASKQAEKDAVKAEKDAVKIIKQGLNGTGEVSNNDIKEALKYLLKVIK